MPVIENEIPETRNIHDPITLDNNIVIVPKTTKPQMSKIFLLLTSFQLFFKKNNRSW